MTANQEIWYGALYEEMKRIGNENTQKEKDEALPRLQRIIQGINSVEGVSTGTPISKSTLNTATSDADAENQGTPIGEAYIAGTGIMGVRKGTLLIREV